MIDQAHQAATGDAWGPAIAAAIAIFVDPGKGPGARQVSGWLIAHRRQIVEPAEAVDFIGDFGIGLRDVPDGMLASFDKKA